MKKIWLKGTAENTVYYYLASEPYVHEIIEEKDITPDMIKSINERKGYPNREWGKYIDIIYPKDEKNETSDEAVELPPGIYRLKPHDGRPMRLEVMSVRDDSYIPLINHGALVDDMGKFLSAKKTIYEPLEWPYRRGYLFYGMPGTGKTAFIRHLVKQDFFKATHRIWMDFVPSNNFVKALNDTETMKLIIMEELLQEGGRLGYDMSRLLEFLDGENSLRDCITIATTNYPQFLHQNLADRQGRFDVLFEMKPQPAKMTKIVMEKWLGRPIKDDELPLEKYSLAQLKEIVLLHKFYSITLSEAADKIRLQSEKFKNEFVTKKLKTGFGINHNDSSDTEEDDD